MIPATYTPRGVSFIINGRPRNVMATSANYDKVITALKANDIEEIENIMDVSSFIAKITNGRVKISDDEVRFDNKKVPDYLAERIIDHNKKGFPIDPLCRFAERLMQNPTVDVREDLYKWVENGDMPVYEDGCFAAYKVVNSDFTPVHKGPYGQDQSVGMTVEMPREACDDNRNSTCSRGLHFCSYEYIPSFMSNGSVIIILKIDPADVVAIPTDYNLSKGRTCRFEVVDTVPQEEAQLVLGGVGVYQRIDPNVYDSPVDYDDVDYGEDWEDDFDDEADYNVSFDAADDEVMVHKPTGKRVSVQGIIADFNNDKLTMQDISNILGIPRSTLSDWKKKLLG